MIENNKLVISVQDLIEVFRGALIALIPFLDRVKIEWRQGQSYDDWDNISLSLYQNIVCASLVGEVSSEYKIAQYDFLYPNYDSLDFLRAKWKLQSEKNFVFVSFQSDLAPLDSVKVAEVDKTNKVIGYATFRYEDVEFSLIKNVSERKEIIDSVTIVL